MRGLAGPQVRTRWSPRADSLERVAKSKFRLPPSGLKPAATASASTRVDLPLPFSPTRKVTPGASGRPPERARCDTTGRVNG
ncbi:hypothetical protein GCM10017786_23800 [Amycolatopsis deserti]|uniref:Uncharacterized protein n=1 Tax=Amycolatopsis deserti TaxID=185696 RepID=A0ABQ3ITT4_9PSEU|nr:hypothetical protein GCM10017786_23800 [Amycolatopsis deserti]